MHELAAKKKGIYIKRYFAANTPPYTMLDENRFSQVLVNIISNAIKFTNKGGI